MLKVLFCWRHLIFEQSITSIAQFEIQFLKKQILLGMGNRGEGKKIEMLILNEHPVCAHSPCPGVAIYGPERAQNKKGYDQI